MEAANHIAMYVTMQQFCMICACTPEPKVQLYMRYMGSVQKGRTMVCFMVIGGFNDFLSGNALKELSSTNLESTQMPIANRLDWKNVAHIHHGILCSLKKDEFMSFAGT